MDALAIVFFLAIIAIPSLIMMNIGVWQLKKAGQAFGDIRRQKDDIKIFEVQRRFYLHNPGKVESDFLIWYGNKKVQFTAIYKVYDPAQFAKWLMEKGKPDSFFLIEKSIDIKLTNTEGNYSSLLSPFKSLEQLKTEVTQKFFAKFPGASIKDFKNWQEEQRREMIPADYVPSLDPIEEEAAVWEGFLAWLDYEEDID